MKLPRPSREDQKATREFLKGVAWMALFISVVSGLIVFFMKFTAVFKILLGLVGIGIVAFFLWSALMPVKEKPE